MEYQEFRRYMRAVLDGLASDGLAQEMVLQQLIAEVQSGQVACGADGLDVSTECSSVWSARGEKGAKALSISASR